MIYMPALCFAIFGVLGVLYMIACKKEGCE